ncbi:hypothetical protein Cni_G03578 [Canna indica]|uniref:C2H2-type domain-containing protein n=1 Tax=Canna indica TaxID=4628 RepID=A0AAQ3JSQ1_9LILI|nr:hypothetical protein Cni_G03578 [Canna indica]
MKPEKEGHDSLNNIIRHTIGKEQFLPFVRTGGKERPFELWKGETAEMNEVKDATSLKENGSIKGTKNSSDQMQALRIPEAVLAFAQAAARANGEPEKYLPGWPLLSPPKVQMQKCEKCSREFCSTVNYRRHILVHRRSLNIDKDFPRNREYLGAFWDKLSLDEAKEILSFASMAIEEVNGLSVISSLSSWIRKPLFSSLPQSYVKAGSALLDVIQEKPASSPISSTEFFGVLDNASEKTFLCTGTAVSIQKFVFSGEVAKIALEMKNLISCVSFMLEQKLVKAWLADKDAEALRCHKLLMEEEEAAQRRQAELLERKRLKKLKQKEQKSKDIFEEENKISSPGTDEGKVDFSGMSSPRKPYHSDSCTPEISENQDHHAPVLTKSQDKMHACTEVADQNADQHQMDHKHPLIHTQHLVSKPKRNIQNGFSGQVPAAKSSVPMRYGLVKDLKASSVTGHKIWTRKNKRLEVPYNRMDKTHQNHSASIDSSEVIIGSISVYLGNGDRSSCQGKLIKSHTRHNNVKQPPAAMLWKPVGFHESADDTTSMSITRADNLAVSSAEASDQGSPNENHLALIDKVDSAYNDTLPVQTNAGPAFFSSKIAEAFLARRWEEAIAADHVKLVLTSETESCSCPDTPEYDFHEAMPESHDSFRRGTSGRSGNITVGVGSIESYKPKFRTKPEKNCKLKYVPKQKNNSSGE